jgi:hypothetical protein
MVTPEIRSRSENEEKIVTKKPYSAPTLVELEGSRTESGANVVFDGAALDTSGG